MVADFPWRSSRISIAFYLIAERSDAEVVDDEELCFGEAPEEAALLLERFGFGDFVDETRETEISNREIVPASGVSEGAASEVIQQRTGYAMVVLQIGTLLKNFSDSPTRM